MTVTAMSDSYGVVDQRTLEDYDRALARLRDIHESEFRELLADERKVDGPTQP